MPSSRWHAVAACPKERSMISYCTTARVVFPKSLYRVLNGAALLPGCVRRRAVKIAAALVLAAAALSAQDVDKLVETARKEFNVPGIAVAVVKDGRTVLEKGYGIRRVGET